MGIRSESMPSVSYLLRSNFHLFVYCADSNKYVHSYVMFWPRTKCYSQCTTVQWRIGTTARMVRWWSSGWCVNAIDTTNDEPSIQPCCVLLHMWSVLLNVWSVARLLLIREVCTCDTVERVTPVQRVTHSYVSQLYALSHNCVLDAGMETMCTWQGHTRWR